MIIIPLQSLSRITDQASISLSRLQAAFAGLVEGRQAAGRPIRGSVYFLYIFSAVFPLTNIVFMGAWSRITVRSVGVTFRMLASDEPRISQE